MTDAARAPRELQVVSPQRVPSVPGKTPADDPADDARPLTIDDDQVRYGE